MTEKFIREHCVDCERCIFAQPLGMIVTQDGKIPMYPEFCGEIDDDGCVSDELRTIKVCPKGIRSVDSVTIDCKMVSHDGYNIHFAGEELIGVVHKLGLKNGDEVELTIKVK